MGGKIEAESQESEGTTFRIHMPFDVINSSEHFFKNKKIDHPIIIASANNVFRNFIGAYTKHLDGQCHESKTYRDAIDLIYILPEDNPGVLIIEKNLIGDRLSDFLESLYENEILKKWFYVILTDYDDKYLFESSWPEGLVTICRNPVRRSNLINLMIYRKIDNSIISNKIKKFKVTQNDSLKILLAEDNLTNQKVASLMIQSAGHTLEIVNNGKEAFEK